MKNKILKWTKRALLFLATVITAYYCAFELVEILFKGKTIDEIIGLFLLIGLIFVLVGGLIKIIIETPKK